MTESISEIVDFILYICIYLHIRFADMLMTYA